MKNFIPEIVCAIALVSDAFAVSEREFKDRELTGFPVVVVGKWTGAEVRLNRQFKTDEKGRKLTTKSEGYTELEVLRVIKGEVKPGVQTLKLGWGWRQIEGMHVAKHGPGRMAFMRWKRKKIRFGGMPPILLSPFSAGTS